MFPLDQNDGANFRGGLHYQKKHSILGMKLMLSV